MNYFKKISINNDTSNINISIIVDIKDDNVVFENFQKDFSNDKFNIDVTDIVKISDNVYNVILENYKKYDISITVDINYMIGYTKLYNQDDKISILENNGDVKGIIIGNGITSKVYNIDSIPDEIKEKICGSPTSNKPNVIEPEHNNNIIIAKDKPVIVADKKIDMKATPEFNSALDNTISMIDSVKPSPDLFEEMKNPDMSLITNVKQMENNNG